LRSGHKIELEDIKADLPLDRRQPPPAARAWSVAMVGHDSSCQWRAQARRHRSEPERLREQWRVRRAIASAP